MVILEEENVQENEIAEEEIAQPFQGQGMESIVPLGEEADVNSSQTGEIAESQVPVGVEVNDAVPTLPRSA